MNILSKNPLFLPIFLEGKILKDDGTFWEVKFTYSRIAGNIKVVKKENYKLTEENLKAAEILLEKRLCNLSVFHSQQAAEKIVKALLFLKGIKIIEHFVSRHFVENILLYIEEKWEERMRKVSNYLFELEEHYIKSRYPIEKKDKIFMPTEEYKREDAEELLKKAKYIFNTVKDYILEVYGNVI